MTPLVEIARLFLKLGTTAFGGPAAHIAMMEDEVVSRRRWLTRERFLDLLGATNLIPGPNSTELAIHIGHARAGWPGLLVAGACFILPAALIVTILAWVYVRYGSLPELAGILYGVKPVVIAVVAQALWRLGRTAVRTTFLGAVAVIAAAASVAGIGEITVLAATGVFVALVRLMERRGAGSAEERGAMAVVPASSVVSLGQAGVAAGAAGATVAGATAFE